MHASGERFIPGQFPAYIENEHRARYRFAASFARGRRVADVACGTGYGTRMLAEAGAQLVQGIDLSEDAIEVARQGYAGPRIRFTIASAENLTSIPDQAFDVVVSFETIEHVRDVSAYLREMARILRPGGCYLVSTPDRRVNSFLHAIRRRPENPFHVREYTLPELVNRVAPHFRVEACYGQAFLPRWLVAFPVQLAIKAVCRLLGTPAARDFKERLYSNQGKVDVLDLPRRRPGIAKFWVLRCTRA